MKITAGDTTFMAALSDNSSVEALKGLLAEGPLTFQHDIHLSVYGACLWRRGDYKSIYWVQKDVGGGKSADLRIFFTHNIDIFKIVYGKALTEVRNCLYKFFPEITAQDKQDFIFSFFPFMFWIYPYTVVTEKQREAMTKTKVNYVYMTVYEITYAEVKKIIECVSIRMEENYHEKNFICFNDTCNYVKPYCLRQRKGCGRTILW